MLTYTAKIPTLVHLPDEDVMELLQGGYETALQELILRYKDKIHSFIYRYTQNHHDCEDLVQETFMRVYRSKHRYQRIAKFSTWVYTIAFNLTKTKFRKSEKMPSTSINETFGDDQTLQLADRLCCEELSQDDRLHQKMCIDYLYKALDQIPEDFKEAVVLRDIKQLSYEEIEQITGVPMGTVKSRINRGRARLKLLLENKIDIETL